MRVNSVGPTIPNLNCQPIRTLFKGACQPIKERNIPLFKQACQPLRGEKLSVRDRYLEETNNAIDEMNRASFLKKYELFTALVIGGGLGVLGTSFFRCI